MTQGIFINGARPATKKALSTAVEQVNLYIQTDRQQGLDPYAIVIEATSLFGNEFDGSLARAANCTYSEGICAEAHNRTLGGSHPHKGPFYLVGPDPHTSRKWYASLELVIPSPGPLPGEPGYKPQWRLK